MKVTDDIQTVLDELDRIEAATQSLVNDLNEESGAFRRNGTGWSASECLEHLAVFNALFLTGMEASAVKARGGRLMRKGSAYPGFAANLFARFLEPPVGRVKIKTPPFTRPKEKTLAASHAAFVESHGKLRFLLLESADLDLKRARFTFPLMTLMKMSLIDGFYVLAAHERRHLWQASDVASAAREFVPVSPLGSRVSTI